MVVPAPLVALSSDVSAPARLQGCCERVPGGLGLGASGAELELWWRLGTCRRAGQVVARSPPTEESNLNPPLREKRAAPAVGMIFRQCRHASRQHEQRDGRDVGVHCDARLAEVVHKVEVDVPQSCFDARASGRAAGLRAMSSLNAPVCKG